MSATTISPNAARRLLWNVQGLAAAREHRLAPDQRVLVKAIIVEIETLLGRGYHHQAGVTASNLMRLITLHHSPTPTGSTAADPTHVLSHMNRQ